LQIFNKICTAASQGVTEICRISLETESRMNRKYLRKEVWCIAIQKNRTNRIGQIKKGKYALKKTNIKNTINTLKVRARQVYT
jgi:hypothetical protein